MQQHLVDIALLVQADPNLNKQIPDFLGLIRTVLDHLEKEPVTVEVTDPRTKQRVKVTINKYVMQLLTASAIGTDAIVAFPRLYLAASKGDFSEIAPHRSLDEGTLRRLRAKLRRTVIRADRPPSLKIPT